MAGMKKAVVLAALLLVLVGATLLVRHHHAQRRRAAERQAWMEAEQADAAISPEFLEDAWVVLLPVIRQKVNAEGAMDGVRRADAAMTELMRKAKTHADWLVWSQINDYSVAKLLQNNASVKLSPLTMQDPDACVVAVMAAMRRKVLSAPLSDCHRIGLQ